MDEMVLNVQRYLNLRYDGVSGYNSIPETGKTGWTTMYALTRALQIELGIATPADNFGNGTSSAYKAWGEMVLGSVPTDDKGQRIVRILQGACYCKGYNPTGFTGTFGEGTKAAIMKLQSDAGLPVIDGKVYDYVFKALLTMDAFILTSGGDSRVREIQRNLNYSYYKTAGVQPCDGHYQRGTQKALIYGIQTEEGIAPTSQTGSVGPTTTNLLPNLSKGSTGNFVKLLQYALYVNGFDPGEFDGSFGAGVQQAVRNFQTFSILSVDGNVGKQTWLSLLVSTGDPTRRGKACDCVTQITTARAQTLIQEGYETVGRYLVNVPNSKLNKKIQPGELQTILNAGLTVFPIYQTIGSYVEYFTREQGKKDAEAAFTAAREYGFLKDTIIYFAVDFDVLGYQITENIIPYFSGIKERMANMGKVYKIGIYGPRAACIEVSNKGLTVSSFVCGMSTGFSGNLGYPLPKDWSFDQISTISIGSGVGKIEIDNNIKSGRDNGESKVDSSIKYPVDPAIANVPFFNQIDEIYSFAIQYTNGKTSYANILLCQYLRERAPKYTGWKWGELAGVINYDFIEKVDKHLGGTPALYSLHDPKFGITHEVEHLGATLNAILNRVDEKDILSDFMGWLGDFLTVASDSVGAVNEGEYASVYDAAFDLIANKDDTISQFSLQDLLADVDALNIASKAIDTTLPLNELLREYYDRTYMKRFSLFVDNRFSGDINKVKEEIIYLLTTNSPIIFTWRNLFKLSFVKNNFSDEEGEQVATAFKDILKNYISKE